jgi:DNA-binding NtrC family response regulator
MTSTTNAALTPEFPAAIAGHSRWANQSRSRMLSTAGHEQNVLITGPEGIGKESLARAIHANSSRRQFPFLVVSCDRLPSPALFDSQVFGHLPGAFAGLKTSSLGIIRAASGGTLFLDGIDCLDADSQEKLFRILSQQVVVPLGGVEGIPVNVRVIASAGGRSPVEDELRADFCRTLNAHPFDMLPLADRLEDVPEICARLLAEFSARHAVAPKRLATSAMDWLNTYEWPGNVRELRRTMDLVSSMHAETIDSRSLRLAMRRVNPRAVEFERAPQQTRFVGFSAIRVSQTTRCRNVAK